jgi:hypothetical protein
MLGLHISAGIASEDELRSVPRNNPLPALYIIIPKQYSMTGLTDSILTINMAYIYIYIYIYMYRD